VGDARTISKMLKDGANGLINKHLKEVSTWNLSSLE